MRQSETTGPAGVRNERGREKEGRGVGWTPVPCVYRPVLFPSTLVTGYSRALALGGLSPSGGAGTSNGLMNLDTDVS